MLKPYKFWRNFYLSKKERSSRKITFFTGSQHEIFEYMRTRNPPKGNNAVHRSRGLYLLHTVVGALVYLRDTSGVNVDYELVIETMKLDNLKNLSRMDIKETLKYDIEFYIKRLPKDNQDIVHGLILRQFSER